ncbi:MAG: type III pantothenate kinase [Bacteroidia bacterium]
MNLVIDIGNTRTKAGVFSGDEPVKQVSFPGFAPTELIALSKEYSISRCLVSTVVDDQAINLFKGDFPVVHLDRDTPLPFSNKYKTPATLGNDRKANIAGAAKLFPGKDVLVIDAGTCLKTDFINSKSEYSGGSISPGLEMRYKSLSHFTSKLPLIQHRSFSHYTGSSTEESIIAGVTVGMISEAEGFIEKYQRDYGDIQLIITGGDSSLFDNTLKNSIFVAPNLALTGLNVILIYNVEKNKK